MKAEKFHWKLPVWDRVIAKHQELCIKARQTKKSCVPEFEEYLDSEFDKGYRILDRYARFIAVRLHRAGMSATDIGIVLKVDGRLVRTRLDAEEGVTPRVVAVPQLNGQRAIAGGFPKDSVGGTILRCFGRLQVGMDLLEEVDQDALGEIPPYARKQWITHLAERIELLQQFQSRLTNEGDA